MVKALSADGKIAVGSAASDIKTLLMGCTQEASLQGQIVSALLPGQATIGQQN